MRAQDDAPPQRRNWAQAIGRDAKSVGHHAFARAGFTDETLVLHWAEIVGPDVARMAQPVKLADKASGGVLTVKAEPAAAVFLQHESRALRTRINTYLGRPVIEKIRFVSGSLVGRPPEHRVRPDRLSQASESDPARLFEGPERLKAALLALAGVRRGAVGNLDD